jgi:hypothetical protein
VKRKGGKNELVRFVLYHNLDFGWFLAEETQISYLLTVPLPALTDPDLRKGSSNGQAYS